MSMKLFSFHDDEQVTRVSMNGGSKNIEHYQSDAHPCAIPEDAARGLMKLCGVIWLPEESSTSFQPTMEMAWRLYAYDGDIARYAGELLETIMAALVLDAVEIKIS
jgi:hypothetical protein